MTVERIYIGGLDPSRLTAKEVVARLEGVDGVQIRSQDVFDEKTFFYINATSDDDTSALDKIFKRYNNVTWKQCKLVVQAAKPHFLHRLAQERLERKRNNNTSDTENQAQDSLLVKQTTGRTIPRHLRIRQRFGEEAFPVDTKPAETLDWSDFAHKVRKIRQKREQQQQQSESSLLLHVECQQQNRSLLAKKRAFRNRAVHLRLNGDSHLHSRVDCTPTDKEVRSRTTTEQSSVSDGTSDSEGETLVNGVRSEYVWSDDESEQTSDYGYNAAVVNEMAISRRGDSDNSGYAGTSSDDSNDVFESDDEEEKTKEAIPVNKRSAAAQYEWSSDDETDQEDGGPTANASHLKPESMKLDTEEFSAAIDFNGGSFVDGDDSNVTESNGCNDCASDAQNLEDDVKSNLGVLSSLFPDMADKTPVSFTGIGNTETQCRAQSEMVQRGWEAGSSSPGGNTSMSAGFRLMQRFDPTKESAQKYIVEPSTTSLNEKKNHAAEPDKGGSSKPQDDAPDFVSAKAENDDSNQAVYEQEKLEDIFRQARSSGAGSESFKLSSMFDSDVLRSSSRAEESKAFAFGFNVDGETATAELPSQATRQGHEHTHETKAGDADAQVVSIQSAQDASIFEETKKHQSTGIRRRGLHFPEETLDEYVNAFLAMNEGKRIMQDPQGFLEDESIKQQWKKERQALTLDWKRKRKYAQSRMKKKMKFR